MPKFLQDIDMPSFWMSYVHVADVGESLDLAVSLGAKCEIEPTPFDADSRFALIRDPAGAGFTLYEGPVLGGRDARGGHGRMSWNELHGPSLDLVGDFYRGLFGWDIARDPASKSRYSVQSSSGQPIASILELDETIKGPKNYWAVYFSVQKMDVALRAVAENGGSVVVRPSANDGQFALALDDQDAAFCLTAS
jgi:predicted enzyme related to lactoylglutathione lyase